MIKDSRIFAGLDLVDGFSPVHILDEEGEAAEESLIHATPTPLIRKFVGLPRCRVAMEIETHSRWAKHLLCDAVVASAVARYLPEATYWVLKKREAHREPGPRRVLSKQEQGA